MSTAPRASDTRAATRQAADALLAEGLRPTVASVRQRIGRGSASTINAALQDWWAELAQRLSEPRRPDVPEAAWKAADALWTAAVAEAQRNLAGERRALEEAREEAKAQVETALFARDQATQRADGVARELETTQRTLREAEQAVAAEKARVDTLRDQVTGLQRQVQAAEQRAAEQARQHEGQLALAQERYDRMEQRLVAQVDEHKTARGRLETQLAMQTKEARDRETALRAELGQAQTELARLRQLADSQAGAQERLTREHATLRTQHEAAQADVARLTASLEREQQAHRQLREDHAAQQQELRGARDQVVELTTRLQERERAQPKKGGTDQKQR